jgi:hypothetical protein
MRMTLSTELPLYDIAVAYRVYPGISKETEGLPFSKDKLQLSEMCLRSFLASLGGLRAKIWALLDGCPDTYETLFRKYVDSGDLVILRFDRLGNRATFGKQIDILLGQRDADLVYFAEDDYFYLPGQFREMLEFMTAFSDVHFLSPYDHPDCYTLDLHRTPKWVRTYRSHHWRTAGSTCLTFLTKKSNLAKHEAVFRSYSKRSDDCGLWLSLTKHRVLNPLALTQILVRTQIGWKSLLKAWRYGWRSILFGPKTNLWVPIPGIATHLNRNLLSPNVDWLSLMQQETMTSGESFAVQS